MFNKVFSRKEEYLNSFSQGRAGGRASCALVQVKGPNMARGGE